MKNDQMIPKRVGIFDIQCGEGVVLMPVTQCHVGIVIGIKEVDEWYRVFTIFADKKIMKCTYPARATLTVLR